MEEPPGRGQTVPETSCKKYMDAFQDRKVFFFISENPNII
jgi:hypothetical protein